MDPEAVKVNMLKKLREMDPEAVKDHVLEKLKEMDPEAVKDYVLKNLKEMMDPEAVKDHALKKLKESWLRLWNFGEFVIAKIDEIIPQETREEKFQRLSKAAPSYLMIATPLFLLSLCCYCCCKGGRSSSGKTMKAPGRNQRISRSKFEGDPKSYFRDLRDK